MRLSVISKRYPDETTSQSYDFLVTFEPCTNVDSDSGESIELDYTIGDPKMEFAVFEKGDVACPNSYLEYEQLGYSMSGEVSDAQNDEIYYPDLPSSFSVV